jgi:hypothetical protein
MKADPIYITFLNYLGGFEYFLFKAEKEFQVEVEEVGQVRNNIFPQWPKSWGETADTIDRSTYRRTRNKVIVRSQHLTVNQRDVLKLIKSSPVVQVVYSRTNRRTVIVDSESFKVYDEADDLFSLQFTISYTDEIPSQRV